MQLPPTVLLDLTATRSPDISRARLFLERQPCLESLWPGRQLHYLSQHLTKESIDYALGLG
jgi:hypothetical protein